MSGQYHWINLQRDEHRFLRPLFDGFGFGTLRLWVEAEVTRESFERTRCGGLITALGEFEGGPVALAWSDFRVNAAAFGHENSRRFVAFLHELSVLPGSIPLVYTVNSAGLSLMEGRRLFSDAFAIWPALLGYADQHSFFTCAVGKCLGLAPILFGLGHYRVAVAENTQLNLTGPDVIARFFGKQLNFAEGASVQRFHERNDLIHEIVPTVDDAFARFRQLLTRRATLDTEPAALGALSSVVLHAVLDEEPAELIPGWSSRVRVFAGTRHGTPIGIFINPPERSDNLITVRTLEKYAAGLDLFRALGMPIVSFLDTPGIDPRFEQGDANNFRKILWVGEKIIHYPHGSMGIVLGRCFGGAATLGFPKVFGGARNVAVAGSRMGTMDPRIIERQLGGSPRLLTQWKESAARQDTGLTDLLANGTLDAVVELADLPSEVDRFLAKVKPALRLLAPRHSREHAVRRSWPGPVANEAGFRRQAL
jgi:acetyl-CoA carboxylase carboxyltransferase component